MIHYRVSMVTILTSLWIRVTVVGIRTSNYAWKPYFQHVLCNCKLFDLLLTASQFLRTQITKRFQNIAIYIGYKYRYHVFVSTTL
jgi:hypothetical protein